MPMKNPPHPGDFIWTEIIEPTGPVGNGGGCRSSGFPARAVQPA